MGIIDESGPCPAGEQYRRFAADRNRIDTQAMRAQIDDRVHQLMESRDRERQTDRLTAAIPLSANHEVQVDMGPAADALPESIPPYNYEVKSWPNFFGEMIAGRKLHDMRDKRDREYKVGDRMLLREYDPFGNGYTGRVALAVITYITSNDTPCAMSSVGLGRDMAILSVRVSGPYPDDDRFA